MIPEIDSAVGFISNILRATINGQSITTEQMAQFQHALIAAFRHRCDGHWFPERPLRGSAYRCVRVVHSSLDKDLASAGTAAGLPESVLRSLLPSELTLWIDPDEVSYRIGEDGSVGIIYDARSAGDSNANVLRPSPIETPSPLPTSPSAKFSILRHGHGPSSPVGLRSSPDTVNDAYRNTFDRIA